MKIESECYIISATVMKKSRYIQDKHLLLTIAIEDQPKDIVKKINEYVKKLDVVISEKHSSPSVKTKEKNKK